jgi:hypothetical protein
MDLGLGAIVMQNCVIASARRCKRSRYQRELDRLDQEVIAAVGSGRIVFNVAP